jgi:4-amino-4-deoxy-L-arabinose transferase-like glycosyltransferase
MLTVSLLIEILRTRPRFVFWLAALTQALLWVAVPSIFYSAPPGDVADVLAVGRQMSLSASYAPPLAYWLAELALRAAGGHIAGVYLLSQLCILVAYWALFQLGRAIVGERHAVLAILLMAGISVFTIGSPDFGPEILMMPLWALTLLHLWRASGEGKQLYWLAVALDLGLMLLTSYLALVLIAALLVFLAITPRGRANVLSTSAAAAGLITAFMLLMSIAFQREHGTLILPDLAKLRAPGAIDGNLIAWVKLLTLVLVAHAGAGILIVLASNLGRTKRAEAAAIARAPIDPYARTMIYYFALVPPIAVTVLTVITGKSDISGVAPLLVLSGLAIVVAGGDTILLHHQRILSSAWFALLLLPPILAAAGALILPAIFAVDLKVAQPADQIARFFTENFERRTGRPLEVVAGDARLASLIGLASARRPRVLYEPDKGLPRLVTPEEVSEKGAIVVWRANDGDGTPPPQIKAQFPSIVPEVPRAFERVLHGRAPLLRIGWGLVRPRAETPK